MNLKKYYFKYPIVLISLCITLNNCKQKTTYSKAIPIDLPYKFKTEKAESLSVKAFNLRKEKKYDEAISLYQQAIAIEPDNPKLFFDVAECYGYQKQQDKELFALDTAIHLDSLNPDFYNNRGLVYWKLYKDENAINDYKKAIELGSKRQAVFCNLALAYYTSKKQTQACEAFNIAKKLGLKASDIADDEYLRALDESCK